jgi:hypothetical protein
MQCRKKGQTCLNQLNAGTAVSAESGLVDRVGSLSSTTPAPGCENIAAALGRAAVAPSAEAFSVPEDKGAKRTDPRGVVSSGAMTGRYGVCPYAYSALSHPVLASVSPLLDSPCGVLLTCDAVVAAPFASPFCPVCSSMAPSMFRSLEDSDRRGRC